MCPLIKSMCLMLAFHVVQSKEGAVLELEDSQNDDGFSTTLELSSTVAEQSEKAESNSETITNTDETATADTRTVQVSLEGNEDRTEHTISMEPDKTLNDKSFEPAASQESSDEISSDIKIEEQKAKQVSNENDSEDEPFVTESLEVGETVEDNSFQFTISQKTISDDVSANIEVGEQKTQRESNRNDSENKPLNSKSLELGETAEDNSFQSTVSQKTISDDVSANIEVEEQRAMQVSTENVSEDFDKTAVSKHLELNETFNSNTFQATVSQKTASDKVSENIEVEVEKSEQVSTGNHSEKIPPVSNLSRKNSDNESQEKISTTSHPELNNHDIIRIKIAAKNDDEIKEVTKKSSGEEPAETVSASGFEGTLESDTADSSFTRRMLGGFVLDSSGRTSKNALPTVASEVDSLPTDNIEAKSIPRDDIEAKSPQTVNNELRSLPVVNSPTIDPEGVLTVNVEANKSVPTVNRETKRVLIVDSKTNSVPTNNREGDVLKVNSEAKSISTNNSEVKSVPTDNSKPNSVPTVNNKAKSLVTVNSTAQSIPTVKSDSKSVPIINSGARSVQTVESVPKSVSTITGQANNSVTTVNSEAKNVPTVNDEARSVPTFKGDSNSVPIVNTEIKSPSTINRVADSVPPVNLEAKSVSTVNGEAKSQPTVNSGAESVPKINSKATRVPTVNNEAKNVPQTYSEAKRVPAVHSRVQVNDEPTTRRNDIHGPPVFTIFPSTLPSESHRQAQYWNEPKLDGISTTASLEKLVPLFLSLGPTYPTLVQIQPPLYRPALEQQFITPPIPYKYANSIFQKLQKATQELQHNMAQQNALHYNQ